MITPSVTNILTTWGEAMADIGRNLMIKYGLRTAPSSTLSDQWVQLTDALIRQGHSPEQAGRAAAKQLFPDFGTHVYASEADAIEAILDAARKR
jgi:hypothetical protein